MDQQHHLAQYRGELHKGRMQGRGTYWFDSGTRYEGEFKDGQFHGEGTLFFSHGGRYVGTWNKGEEESGEYIFKDGLEYEPDEWDFCTKNVDRRFYPEHIEGLRPADRYMRCPESDAATGAPLRFVPDSWYDTCDGIYNPRKRVVYRYGKGEDEPVGDFLRNATDEEHEWIITNCRKGWDEFIGYRPNK